MADKDKRAYTTKQLGDAGEMLVAAELTLAGVPALKVPDNWPCYDIIAQSECNGVKAISVKTCTYKKGAAFVRYRSSDKFDWLAIVVLDCPEAMGSDRCIYLVPRTVANRKARVLKKGTKHESNRYWRIDEIEQKFQKYKSNFSLHQKGKKLNVSTCE